MLVALLDPRPDGVYLDLGCGEGQGMRAVHPATAVGCDLNPSLLRRAATDGPVVRARLPGLGWLRSRCLDGAFAMLVVEHLPDIATLFDETFRVVRPGGCLVVVMNHPSYTPPGAGPVVDPTDDEVFWRWGAYFAEGSSVEPSGDRSLTFHHRPLATILNQAARAGWRLVRVEERPAGPGTAGRDALLARQANIPRLLAARWERP